MPELSVYQWTLALLGALAVGLGKGGVPGVGNLTVAIYAQVFAAKESVGILLPVLICADVVAIIIYRQHAEWRYIIKLFPITAVGVIVGFLCFNFIPVDPFQTLIGTLLLAMTVLHFIKKHHDSQIVQRGLVGKDTFYHGKLFIIGTGITGGVATMLANAAGPVASFYLMAMNLPKYAFIGTTAWFFFLINLFKVPFQVALGNINFISIQLSMVLGSVAALGAFFAPHIVKHIPQKQFEWFIWALIVLSGFKLMLG